MKKIFLAVFSLFLILPFQIEAKELLVKMAFGLTQAGRINGSGDSLNDYFGIKHLKPEKSSFGIDASLEFIYQFHPNFGLALGFGFAKQTPNGTSVVFIPPEGSAIEEEFQLNPMFSSEIYPVYMNGIYFIRLFTSHQMCVFGGVGYYFGRFLCGRDASDVAFRFYNFKEEYFCWSYESNANTLGYHIGVGIDFDFSNNMYLSVEGLYRAVSFSIHKTSVIQDSRWSRLPFPVNNEEAGLYGEDSTFFYGYRTDENAPERDIQYNVNSFDFSGFSLRVALKFKF